MYFFVQYIDTAKDETENRQSLSMDSVHSLNGLETKKLMVNPNCPVQIILDYVCSQINVDKNANYDFCNLETGEMIGIKTLKPWMYPTNILKSKETYVIVFYEMDEFGQYSKLEPLISRQSKYYSDILLKIKRKLSSTARRASSSIRKSKGRRGSNSSKGSTADSFSSIREAQQKKKTSNSSAKSKKSISSKN